MESHKRVLGIIYIVSGVLLVMVMMALSMFFSVFATWLADSAGEDQQWIFSWLFPFISSIAILICVFIALPSLIAGWGLLNNKSWAMLLALIVGCLRLFSFPIGTAIGIYTIWVYAEDNRLRNTSSK